VSNGEASLVQERFDEWRKYLHCKHNLYLGYAYHQLARSLNAELKGGSSVACVNKALECANEAVAEGEQLSHPKEATSVMNEFVAVLQKDVRKFVGDNDQVFFDLVPAECPELPPPQALVKPQPFAAPQISPAWTMEIVNAFGISTNGTEGQQEVPEQVIVPPHMPRGTEQSSSAASTKQEDCILF